MYAFETRGLTVDEREEFLAHVKIDYPGATIDDVPVWICEGPSGSTVGYGQTVKQAQRGFYGFRSKIPIPSRTMAHNRNGWWRGTVNLLG